MNRDRTGLYLWTALALCAAMLGEISCAKKQLSSGSEGQSMSAKDKAATETIQPDRIASIAPPDETPAAGGESGIRESRTTSPSSSTRPTTSVPPVAASALSDKSATNMTDTSPIADIYFDFDQYDIRADAQTVLERNGQWVRTASGKSLLIECHCDERGTLAYNLVLGEKRAKSAKRYLENLGIPASRLQTTSYGEVKPTCREHNEGCWKYNRRAHFVVH